MMLDLFSGWCNHVTLLYETPRNYTRVREAEEGLNEQFDTLFSEFERLKVIAETVAGKRLKEHELAAEERHALQTQLDAATAQTTNLQEVLKRVSLELHEVVPASKMSNAHLRSENATLQMQYATTLAENAEVVARNSVLYNENTTYRIRGLGQGHGTAATR